MPETSTDSSAHAPSQLTLCILIDWFIFVISYTILYRPVTCYSLLYYHFLFKFLPSLTVFHSFLWSYPSVAHKKKPAAGLLMQNRSKNWHNLWVSMLVCMLMLRPFSYSWMLLAGPHLPANPRQSIQVRASHWALTQGQLGQGAPLSHWLFMPKVRCFVCV